MVMWFGFVIKLKFVFQLNIVVCTSVTTSTKQPMLIREKVEKIGNAMQSSFITICILEISQWRIKQ